MEFLRKRAPEVTLHPFSASTHPTHPTHSTHSTQLTSVASPSASRFALVLSPFHRYLVRQRLEAMTHVIPTPESKRHVLSTRTKRTEALKRCHRIFLCRNGCRKAKLGRDGLQAAFHQLQLGLSDRLNLSPLTEEWNNNLHTGFT